MSRSEWVEPFEGPSQIGGRPPQPGEPPDEEATPWGPDVGVCPGAVLEHPFVRDVVTARVAMEGGCLTTFITEPSHVLLEGVLILKSRFNVFERAQLRKSKTAAAPGTVVGPPPR